MQLSPELQPLTSTLQQTQAWIKDTQSALGENTSPQQAFTVLRAGLHALRDRIDPHEAVQLASHLPLPIKGTYYDGFKLNEPVKSRHLDDFIQQVRDELAPARDIDPRIAFEATLQVLAVHVPPGEMADVRRMFAKELQPLFEEAMA